MKTTLIKMQELLSHLEPEKKTVALWYARSSLGLQVYVKRRCKA